MPVWGRRNVWHGAPAPTTDQYLCMQLEVLKQMGSQASVLFLPDRPRRHPTLPITHKHTGARVLAPSQRHEDLAVLSQAIQTNSALCTLCSAHRSFLLGHSRRRKGTMWASSSCWETLQAASLTLPLVLSAQPLPITNRRPVPHSKVVCHAQQ